MNSNLRGIIFILLSAFFFGSYGVWSKLIGTGLENFNQAWSRAIIILIIIVPIGIYQSLYGKIRREDYKWFLIVSLFGSFVLAPYFYAFNHIHVGTATILFYSSLTISSYIIGKFVFYEKINRIKIFSLIFSITGILILIKFDLSVSDLFSVFCCIVSGIFGGVEVAFTKKIPTKYSAIQISTCLFLLLFIINFAFSLLTQERGLSLEPINIWIYQVLYAIAMLLGFLFVVKGYRYLEPSIAGLIGLLEIVIGVLFGIFVFSETITIFNIIGMGIIIFGISLPYISALSVKYVRK